MDNLLSLWLIKPYKGVSDIFLATLHWKIKDINRSRKANILLQSQMVTLLIAGTNENASSYKLIFFLHWIFFNCDFSKQLLHCSLGGVTEWPCSINASKKTEKRVSNKSLLFKSALYRTLIYIQTISPRPQFYLADAFKYFTCLNRNRIDFFCCITFLSQLRL